MKREEILAMQPGNKLNMKVAEKVMGHKVVKDQMWGYVEGLVSSDGSNIWSKVEPYSEDISAAELVVNRMIEIGYKDAINWSDFGNGKYTKAEAICKAALLAILERDVLIETSDKILRQALGDEEKGCT